MQERAATPTSKGDVTVDGRVLDPQDAMLYYEFNPRDFEQHWYAEQQNPKLLGRELPVTAENFMMMQTMKRLNKFWEYSIWRSRIQYKVSGDAVDPTTKGGVSGDATYCYIDGLIKKALDSSDIISIAGAVALTTSNIRDKFTIALNAVPKAKLFKYGPGGLKFLVSYADKMKYDEALRTDTYKNTDSSETGFNRYRGYEVEALAGLPENTFFLCFGKPDIDSDLWLGLNSTEDMTTLEMKRLQNNSELFYIKGLFKVDTQIGFADQVVVYTTMTA